MPITDAQVRRLLDATEHDPFATLGVHREGSAWVVRVYRPGAQSLRWGDAAGTALKRVHPGGLFEIRLKQAPTAP